MSNKTLLASLFGHKAGADREMFEALASCGLDGASDRLRSALRVLHHAHTVDRIFAANLQRRDHAFKASWSNAAPAMTDLATAVGDTDAWYLDYVSTVAPEALEEAIEFTFTDGTHGRMSREEMLAHVVTHAGYHRGEVWRLLPEIEGTAMRDVFAGYLHRAEPQRRG